MHDPVLVRIRQCAGDLDADADDLVGCKPPELVEGAAVHQLHGDEVPALLLADLVDGADVRVVQRRSAARLAQQLRTRARLGDDFLGQHLERDVPLEALVVSAIATATRRSEAPTVAVRGIRPGRIALHAFLIAMVAVWLFPLFWAVYSSLRPVSDTILNGYLSWPKEGLSLDNYKNFWTQADLPYYYLNTLVIAIPAVVLTLLLASMVAFACTQFNWRFNLATLMIFTAGNLLPPQVIIVPLYRMYLSTPIPNWTSIDIARFSFPIFSDKGFLYDQYIGIMLIHIVFQTGFATFVLSNYMKTISKEITESAIIDGAHVLRIWWNIVLPLCRPALAAMATLLFTFIYNDFFWALLLIKTGDRRPITSALNNMQGEFFVNNNMIAAGAMLVAIPPILVYIFLQKQFIAGLTLGSTKG